MSTRRRFNNETKMNILNDYKKGIKLKEIRNKYKCNDCTIYYLVRKYSKTNRNEKSEKIKVNNINYEIIDDDTALFEDFKKEINIRKN